MLPGWAGGIQGEVLGEWQPEMTDFEILWGCNTGLTGVFQGHFGPGREGENPNAHSDG